MKKKFKSKSKNDKIEEVNVCDIYEIGNWINIYPWIKLGYNDKNYNPKYSDIAYYIKSNTNILGYFIVYNIINLNSNDIIPIFSKKLVLYDFAVSAKAYAKYGKELFNHLINYAKENGYSLIEIIKYDEYKFFYDFLKRHYKIEELNGSFYYLIDNPNIKKTELHLQIYEHDNVNIEDIYYLYDLNASVLKSKIKLRLDNGESILIDRKTGIIKFPSNIKILNDDVVLNSYNRDIVHLIKNIYRNSQKDILVDFRLLNKDIFEVYVEDVLYTNKDLSSLINGIHYVLNMVNKGIKVIYPYIINYNMNDSSFAYKIGGIKCNDIIEKFTSSCDSKANTTLERINEKKKIKEFNIKLNNIKRFDFRFGNSFCGIKKLTIVFDEGVEILSNGQIENNIIPIKEDILKELELFNFINWESKYNNNIKPKFENSWSIKLVFEDEKIEFIGFDDFPKVWPYVEWFINKYSKFKLNKE